MTRLSNSQKKLFWIVKKSVNVGTQLLLTVTLPIRLICKCTNIYIVLVLTTPKSSSRHCNIPAPRKQCMYMDTWKYAEELCGIRTDRWFCQVKYYYIIVIVDIC